MANNQLISLTEAASLLDVSTATLRNWDKKGHLMAIRNPVNRYRMYMLSDVLTSSNEPLHSHLWKLLVTRKARVSAGHHLQETSDGS